jgi:hypothetical protein
MSTFEDVIEQLTRRIEKLESTCNRLVAENAKLRAILVDKDDESPETQLASTSTSAVEHPMLTISLIKFSRTQLELFTGTLDLIRDTRIREKCVNIRRGSGETEGTRVEYERMNNIFPIIDVAFNKYQIRGYPQEYRAYAPRNMAPKGITCIDGRRGPNCIESFPETFTGLNDSATCGRSTYMNTSRIELMNFGQQPNTAGKKYRNCSNSLIISKLQT